MAILATQSAKERSYFGVASPLVSSPETVVRLGFHALAWAI